MVSTGEDGLAWPLTLRITLSYAGCRVHDRILGGTADVVVNNRMHVAVLPLVVTDCTFEHVDGIGHMLHHFVPEQVAQFVCKLSVRTDRVSCTKVAPPVRGRHDQDCCGA